MTNLFLKVNKDLFKLGLNPTEVLLLAQIIEFNTTTGSFFMSDKALAEMLNVSDKTVSRALAAIESKGFITRETKNIKGGKSRTIVANMAKIEQQLTTDNLSIVELQGTKCPLTTDKLSGDKGQNDFIKDNIIDKEKDKNTSITASAVIESSSNTASAELEATKELPIVTVSELVAMGARGAKYTLLDDNTVLVLSTGKRLRVKE